MHPNSESPGVFALRRLTAALALLATSIGVFGLSVSAMIIERWAGVLVFGVLATSGIVLLLRGRRPFHNRVAHSFGLTVAALLLVPAAFYAPIFEAGLDDGPFYGRPFVGDLSMLEASHSIAYRFGDLVFYNRSDDESPILAYVVEATPKWALELDVSATPGFGHTEFRSVSRVMSVSQEFVDLRR